MSLDMNLKYRGVPYHPAYRCHAEAMDEVACDADAADEVDVTLTGVWELPKASGQINRGAAMWWNATNGEVRNVTGAGFFPIGVAVRGAGRSSDTTCRVQLSGSPGEVA